MKRTVALFLAFCVTAGTATSALADPAGTMQLSGGAHVICDLSTTIDSAVTGADTMQVRIKPPGGVWSLYTPAPVSYQSSYLISIGSSGSGTYTVEATYYGSVGPPLVVHDDIYYDNADIANTLNDSNVGGYGIPRQFAGWCDDSTDPDDWWRLSYEEAHALQQGTALEVTLTCDAGASVALYRSDQPLPIAVSTQVAPGVHRLALASLAASETLPNCCLLVRCSEGGGSYRLESHFYPIYAAGVERLDLYVSKGRNPAPQLVPIECRILPFAEPMVLTDTASWLSCAATMDPNVMMGDTAVEVTVNSSALSVGTYNATVTVDIPNGGERVFIPVRLHVQRPTAVRLRSASSVTYGGRIKYVVDSRRASKWASDAPRDPGATIEVYRNGDLVKTLKTGSKGTVAFYLTHRAHDHVKVRRVRSASRGASTSNTRQIAVRWKITLTFEAYHAIAYRHVDFTIRVVPAGVTEWDDIAGQDVFYPMSAGRRVRLQVHKDGAWRFFLSGDCDDNGEAHGWTTSSPRTRRFRAYMPAGAGYAAGHSKAKTVSWR